MAEEIIDGVIIKESESAVTQNNSYMSDDLISNFKSLYYMFNATPDTTSRIFNDGRIVSYEDLSELNEKIQAKFKNHHMSIIESKISVHLTKGDIKEFTNWSEFTRTDWGISRKTISINLQWDILLVLPNYKVPQRHTIRLRIGTRLKPEEMFKLMMESETDAEIVQNVADVVCRIDFVNSVFCDEILSIIENWYKSLKKDKSLSKLGEFLKGKSETISSSIKEIFPFLAILVIFIITLKLLNSIDSVEGIIITTTHLKYFLVWIFCSFIFVATFKYIGDILARYNYKKSTKIKKSPLIVMTKGDKQKLEEVNRENSKVIRDIMINLVASSLMLVATGIYGIFKSLF